MSLKIKKGDKFLCIKGTPNIRLGDGGRGFSKGEVYNSNENGCLSSNCTHPITGELYYTDFSDVKEELFNKHFEKILSEEEENTLIMKKAREEAEGYKTHIDKGGRYKVITDSASFQVGDLWIRAVVYECLDNSVIYVREYENFCKKFI